MDDATAERLLRGSAPADRPELEPLSLLLSQVRDLGDADIKPTPALYALIRDGFDPAAITPTVPPARSTARRRIAALAGASLTLKVLTGAGVALAGVTTAAGAGVLPGPVQEGVAGIVRTLTPFELDPRPAPSTGRPASDVREEPTRVEPTLPDPAPVDEPPRATPQPDTTGRPGTVPGPPDDRVPAEPAPAQPAPAQPAPAQPAPAQPAPAPQERPGETARPGEAEDPVDERPTSGSGAPTTTGPR